MFCKRGDQMEERIYSLDYIRVLAVLAVILTHTSALIVTGSMPPELNFWIGNIFDSLSRLGVILFVMVSGALMLDENRPLTLRKLFCKKIVGIVALIIFWSAFYAFIYRVAIPSLFMDPVDWRYFFTSFVSGHYHMWYLNMLVGLYLATPFLRAFVKKDDITLVKLFIGVSAVSQFFKPLLKALRPLWPDAKLVLDMLSQFHLSFFSGFVACYLLGWYLLHVGLEKRHEYALYVAGALSLLATILYVGITGDYKNGYSNMNVFIFIYAASVFYALVQYAPMLKDKALEMMTTMAKLSFGVYIIHPLVLSYVITFWFDDMPALAGVIVWTLTVAVLSFIICWALSKIPVLRKTIRM